MKNRPRNLCVYVCVVLAAATASSCSVTSATDPALLLAGTVSPTNNPLVAQYSIVPPAPAKVEIEFGTDTTYGRKTWLQPTPPGGGAVSILVAGMHASTVYHMRARVHFDLGGEAIDSDHTFTTGAIPSGVLPQALVTQPRGSSPNPGIELADLYNLGQNTLRPVAFDEEGNLIWYYDFGPAGSADSPHPIKLLSNGHMLINVFGGQDTQGFREVDLAGNLIRELSATSLNQELAAAGFSLVTAGMHHDFALLPNGHTIALTYEYRTFTDLPGFPGQTEVAGDALVDLDADWKPVWTWSTFDHLDVNRHPMAFPDWTHSNAILYSPDDGNLILSSRHQYWVMKIDYNDGRGTGDILWRLGPGGDFTLTNGGPADWNYAQHYPNLISPRSMGVFPLALFDNGNNRPVNANGDVCGGPDTAACYSRPVVFEINEIQKTATNLWQYKLPEFSLCCGNIGRLPNGNIEFDIAFASTSPQVAAVEEVTYEDSPRLVWQMSFPGQLAYRATRIPSLYPGVEW